jgi:hypothetical protein
VFDSPRVVRRAKPTTLLDRVLLGLPFLVLPVENLLPTFGGLSVAWLSFAAIALFLIICRTSALGRVLRHPLCISFGLFLVVTAAIEMTHELSSLSEWFRIAQMFAGAVMAGALCRDRQALRFGLNTAILTGLIMTIVLMLSGAGVLYQSKTATFEQATVARDTAFGASGLIGDINRTSYVTAVGALFAFAIGTSLRRGRTRNLYFAASLICLFGTLLSLSRAGVLIAAVSGFVILIVRRGGKLKSILLAVALAGAAVMISPTAAIQRLEYSTEKKDGRMEGRAMVYTRTFEALDQYWLVGVGSGDFWQRWAFQNGFSSRRRAFGSHNAFFQMMIYWGIAGLAMLVTIVVQAFRTLPRRLRADFEAVALLGLLVSVVLRLASAHNLYAKEYSLIFGLLLGAGCWIWPGRRLAPPETAPQQPGTAPLDR